MRKFNEPWDFTNWFLNDYQGWEMKNNRFASICVGLFALGSIANVNAALTQFGTQSLASVADCPSFCTNFTFGPELGGFGIGVSGVSSVSQSRGNARASASLTGNLNSPILKAEAFANPNFKGAFATAFAVQGYTYEGVGETLVLDVSLDGLVVDPHMDESDTSAQMDVVIYAPEPFGFFPTAPPSSSS